MSDGRPEGAPEFVPRTHAEDHERRATRERGYQRAVRVGLVVSVAVHLLVLFLLGGQLRVPDMGYEPLRLPTDQRAQGLRLVRVTAPPSEPTPPTTSPDRPRPEAEEPDEEVADRDPEEETTQEGAEEPDEEETEVTNAERLQPREGDPRLWKEFWDEDLERRYLGGTARADSAIRAILGRYLDSLRLTDEELARARDWTFTEGEERWGISPEGIHLGRITIPLPVDQLLSPTGPRRRELERELRELSEIQRQEALLDAASTREERIEAMRERSRKEAEEREAEEDSTPDGGG